MLQNSYLNVLCNLHGEPVNHFNIEINLPKEKRLCCQSCPGNYKRIYLAACEQYLQQYLEEDIANYEFVFEQVKLIKNNLQTCLKCLEFNCSKIILGLKQAIENLDTNLQNISRVNQKEGYFNKQQLQEFTEYLILKQQQNPVQKNFQEKKKQQYENEEKQIREQFIQESEQLFQSLNMIQKQIQDLFESSKFGKTLSKQEDIQNLNYALNKNSNFFKKIDEIYCLKHNILINRLDMGSEAKLRVTCSKCENQFLGCNIKPCLEEYLAQFRLPYLEKYQGERNKIVEMKQLFKTILSSFRESQSQFEVLVYQIGDLEGQLQNYVDLNLQPFNNVNYEELKAYAELHYQLFKLENNTQFQKQEAEKQDQICKDNIYQVKLKKFDIFQSTIDVFKNHVQKLNKLYSDFLEKQGEQLLSDQLNQSLKLNVPVREEQKETITIENGEKFLIIFEKKKIDFVNIQQNKSSSYEVQSDVKAFCMQSNSQWFAIVTEETLSFYTFVEGQDGSIQTVSKTQYFEQQNIKTISAQKTSVKDLCFAIDYKQVVIYNKFKGNWINIFSIQINVCKLISNKQNCLMLTSVQQNKNNYQIYGMDLDEKLLQRQKIFQMEIDEQILDFSFHQNQKDFEEKRINVFLFYQTKIQYLIFFEFKQQIKNVIQFQTLTKETIFSSCSENFLIYHDDIIQLHQMKPSKDQQQFQNYFRGAFSFLNMSVKFKQISLKSSVNIKAQKLYISNQGNYIVFWYLGRCKVFSVKLLPNVENLVLAKFSDF